MRVAGIIPARFASSRFAGKALARIEGKTLIRHVYERSLSSACLRELIVATDDARIAEEVGELSRLVNHLYGPKPKKASEPSQELGEELADILFASICLANSQGIDLGDSLDLVLEKVWRRDRERYRAVR